MYGVPRFALFCDAAVLHADYQRYSLYGERGTYANSIIPEMQYPNSLQRRFHQAGKLELL